jgi:hypothetical protein
VGDLITVPSQGVTEVAIGATVAAAMKHSSGKDPASIKAYFAT